MQSQFNVVIMGAMGEGIRVVCSAWKTENQWLLEPYSDAILLFNFLTCKTKSSSLCQQTGINDQCQKLSDFWQWSSPWCHHIQWQQSFSTQKSSGLDQQKQTMEKDRESNFSKLAILLCLVELASAGSKLSWKVFKSGFVGSQLLSTWRVRQKVQLLPSLAHWSQMWSIWLQKWLRLISVVWC